MWKSGEVLGWLQLLTSKLDDSFISSRCISPTIQVLFWQAVSPSLLSSIGLILMGGIKRQSSEGKASACLSPGKFCHIKYEIPHPRNLRGRSKMLLFLDWGQSEILSQHVRGGASFSHLANYCFRKTQVQPPTVPAVLPLLLSVGLTRS